MKVLVNQMVGYLFANVVNAISERENVILICGKNSLEQSYSNRVKTISVMSYDKSSTFRRLWTWLISTVQIWWIVLTRFNKAELLLVSNPPFCNLLALILPNKKISHLVYDIYPDVLVNGNIISNNGLIDRLWSNFNKRIFKNAKHVYTLSQGMAECMSNYMPLSNIEIIPCWADNTLYKVEKSENLFIKENQLEGKFIVMYSGNIGNTHRVETLIDVANVLKDNDDIRFVIIGEGGKKKLIRKKISEYSINNVLLFTYQSKEMLSHSLGSADIAVVTLDANASKLSVPSKTFNLMYLGKVILCLGGKESELERLVGNYGIGKIFHTDAVDEIVNFIMSVIKSPEILRQYQINSEKACKIFSQNNAKRFLID